MRVGAQALISDGATPPLLAAGLPHTAYLAVRPRVPPDSERPPPPRTSFSFAALLPLARALTAPASHETKIDTGGEGSIGLDPASLVHVDVTAPANQEAESNTGGEGAVGSLGLDPANHETTSDTGGEGSIGLDPTSLLHVDVAWLQRPPPLAWRAGVRAIKARALQGVTAVACTGVALPRARENGAPAQGGSAGIGHGTGGTYIYIFITYI